MDVPEFTNVLRVISNEQWAAPVDIQLGATVNWPLYMVDSQGSSPIWVPSASDAGALSATMAVVLSRQPGRPVFHSYISTTIATNVMLFPLNGMLQRWGLVTTDNQDCTGQNPIPYVVTVPDTTAAATVVLTLDQILHPEGYTESSNVTAGDAGTVQIRDRLMHMGFANNNTYIWVNKGDTITLAITRTYANNTTAWTVDTGVPAAANISYEAAVLYYTGNAGAQPNALVTLTKTAAASTVGYMSTTAVAPASGYICIQLRYIKYVATFTATRLSLGPFYYAVTVETPVNSLAFREVIPPEFRATGLLNNCRTVASSMLLSNVSMEDKMGGTMYGTRVHDSSPAMMGAGIAAYMSLAREPDGGSTVMKDGFYTWVPPEQGDLEFRSYMSDYGTPKYYLDTKQPQHCIVMCPPGVAAQFRIEFCHVLEFTTPLQLYGRALMSPYLSTDLELARRQLRTFPMFTENPNHVRNFLNAIGRGARNALGFYSRHSTPINAAVSTIAPEVGGVLEALTRALAAAGVR